MRRTEVVVTGVGATTPLGGTATDTWAGLVAGRGATRELAGAWAAALPARLAAEAAVEPGVTLSTRERRNIDRHTQFALVAAREAWEQAGAPAVDPDRLAVVVGTGIGGGLTTMAQHDVLQATGPSSVSPFTVPMLMPNAAAAALSVEFTARGGAHTVTTACAAGAEAIALGADLIRAGRVDVVIAGGAEACIHPFALSAFARMGALSVRHHDPAGASRPFDRGRDGFVMAEGAATVVLQRADDVTPDRCLARVLGHGITSDATHLVAPHQDGQVAAMRTALRDADLTAGEVTWVNAHATSTPKGDSVEARSIAEAVRPGVLTTATKSMTGHLLGASGALSAVVTVLALRHAAVPAIRNLGDAADDVGLDLVRGVPRRLRERAVALTNSFGFGGHNVALAFAL